MGAAAGYTILALAGLLSLAGIAGCVLPVVPGPPLGFIALLLVGAVRGWDVYGWTTLTILAAITAAVTVVDYILPPAVAKKFGASRGGLWGCAIGMIAGIFLFPPFGMILGSCVGAIGGELLSGRTLKESIRSAFGVVTGTAAAAVLKLTVAGVLLYYYITGAF